MLVRTICIAALSCVAITAVPPVSGDESACAVGFVSPHTEQYVFGFGTVFEQSVYAVRADGTLHPLGPAVLPDTMNLDALDVLSSTSYLFSVDRDGFVATTAGLVAVEHNDVYRMDFGPAGPAITPALDWSAEGLRVLSLDAVHRVADDVFWFSTASTHAVSDGGSSMWLRPWQAWELDRGAVPRLRLVHDAGRQGVLQVDALAREDVDVLQLSPASLHLLPTAGGLLRLWPQNAYSTAPGGGGPPALAFDGTSAGLSRIDAYDVGDGLACDDGDACTTDDACLGGSCVGGPPPDCDDGNPCTDDECEADLGCVHRPRSGVCDDDSLCNGRETCLAGECVGGVPLECDDGNPCTDDACEPTTGCASTDNTEPCDDGNECTVGDACGDGRCAGIRMTDLEPPPPAVPAACDCPCFGSSSAIDALGWTPSGNILCSTSAVNRFFTRVATSNGGTVFHVSSIYRYAGGSSPRRCWYVVPSRPETTFGVTRNQHFACARYIRDSRTFIDACSPP